jgi:hypothetical protein
MPRYIKSSSVSCMLSLISGTRRADLPSPTADNSISRLLVAVLVTFLMLAYIPMCDREHSSQLNNVTNQHDTVLNNLLRRVDRTAVRCQCLVSEGGTIIQVMRQTAIKAMSATFHQLFQKFRLSAKNRIDTSAIIPIIIRTSNM